MSSPLIYKASAGSGKTFALTLEYFKIVFRRPYEYKNILAVTFTNKATEEMKHRIVGELHKMAMGEESSYIDILSKELNIGKVEIRDKSILLRSLLLHDYGRFSVTTIDSFFQNILKAFTREIGITPGYNILLENKNLLNDAIEAVLEKGLSDNSIKKWISDLMQKELDRGKSWNIRNSINSIGVEIFNEKYNLLDKELLDKFGNREFLDNYRLFLANLVKSYENFMLNKGKEAVKIILDNELFITDFKYGKSGCVNYFFKNSLGDFSPPGLRARDSVESENLWFTAKSEKKSQIISILGLLMPIMQEIIEYHDSNNREYLTAINILSNMYQLGLLSDINHEVRRISDERGEILLSDITFIINKLINNNDAPFLYEKMGNIFHHIMIDEFQDTSQLQWNNFKPLVLDVLSEGGKAMIVGDVKQSIYRWRNGDWRLLAEGVENGFRDSFDVKNIVLEANWRSSKDIVEFNNIFFSFASVYLYEFYNLQLPEHEKYSSSILSAYSDIIQEVKKQNRGYVNIKYDIPLDENRKEVGNEVIRIILDIIERGGNLSNIAILVREQKEGVEIAKSLIEYNASHNESIKFVSGDSLYILNSLYVNFIIGVLKYLSNNDDNINKSFLYNFYNIYLKNEINTDFVCIDKDIFEDMTGIELDISKLYSGSLFEKVEYIIEYYKLNENCEELPYIIAFQDMVLEFSESQSNSISLFIEWFNKEGEKRVLPANDGVDAVNIMTIHKSKGLEFDYVIMPFCMWEIDNLRHRRRIWCKNNHRGFDALEYVPINYSTKLKDTFFDEDYCEEHMRAFVDNLNLLYVAFTRAKNELYLRSFIPKEYNSIPNSITIIELIKEVLNNINNETDFKADFGEYEFSCGIKNNITKHKPDGNLYSLEKYSVGSPADSISVKYRFKEYNTDDREEAIDKGKIMHEIFSQIINIGDAAKSLERSINNGLIESKDYDEFYSFINNRLMNPEVSEWFDSSNNVYTERDIMLSNGSKIRPDRVIINDKKTIIIDYKFGLKKEKSYERQILTYCKAMSKMGYKNIEGYIWYLSDNSISKVSL